MVTVLRVPRTELGRHVAYLLSKSITPFDVADGLHKEGIPLEEICAALEANGRKARHAKALNILFVDGYQLKSASRFALALRRVGASINL